MLPTNSFRRGYISESGCFGVKDLEADFLRESYLERKVLGRKDLERIGAEPI
jgi:hypothetical protein